MQGLKAPELEGGILFERGELEMQWGENPVVLGHAQFPKTRDRQRGVIKPLPPPRCSAVSHRLGQTLEPVGGFFNEQPSVTLRRTSSATNRPKPSSGSC